MIGPLTPASRTGPVFGRSRTLLGLAVVAILLVQLIAAWPWIVSSLEGFQAPVWRWFVLALVADIASMGAYARMQRRLLKVGGTDVSLPSAAALAYASHSLSDTLPGGPAFSAVFSFRRMRQLGASAGAASWVIAFSGAVSAAALVVIGLVAALVATGSTDTTAVVGYLALAVLVVLGGRLLDRRPALASVAATRLVRGTNRVLRRDMDRGVARVRRLLSDIGAVRMQPRDVIVTSALALVNWLLDALCLYLCLVAVGVEAAPVPVLLAYTAGMAALSVPLVPAGLGVVDAAMVLGLVAGGVSVQDAIAGTVLFRIITLGMIIGAGWVVWGLIRTPASPSAQDRLGPQGDGTQPASAVARRRADW